VVNALGVRVDNTPPYRPELKAIVEQDFNMANQELIHNLPGAKSKPPKRGDKNVCLEACLTLEEFRKLMILRILKHNNHHRYNDYPMDKEMIADHVEPYPVDLWHWGIQNRTGHLRTMPQDAIHLHLLPREKASVTPHGIKFKGLYYVCDLALREEWFERARERGQWSVLVVWDPRRVDTIYLPPEAGRQIEVCWLTDKSRTFKACDWEDVIDYFELKKQREEAARTRQYQSEAKYNAQVEAIVKPAREEAQEARKGHSERSIIQGMLENQKREREIERRREAWDLASGDPSGRAAQEMVPYIPPPEYIDELERHLEEEADEQP
jgi:putative transposase